MPPLGVLLLLFSKKFTKKGKIFGAVWLCLLFIFASLPNDESQDITQEKINNETTINQTAESNDSESVLYTMTKSNKIDTENMANQSLDKYIPYLIKSTVGEKTNMGHKSLLSYQVDSDDIVYFTR